MFLHTDSLDLEHVVYEQRAMVQPPPAVIQLASRQRGVQFLLDLTITYSFPAQTSKFALQITDLTQIWSNELTGIIEYDDLLAMATTVHIYIKLRDGNLMTSHNSIIATPLSRSYTGIQDIATPGLWSNNTNWIDIYRRRHTLRQQLQRDPLFQEQHATLADSLAFLANQLAATHIWDVPFSFTSTATQISMAG